MAVKSTPDGYHSVTPYLIVPDAAGLIDFLQQVFESKEVLRLAAPEGRIGHAELRIGNAVIMLADAHGEHQPTQTMLHVYVPEVDATWRRALAAGATAVREPANQFYGDRGGAVSDDWGNRWWIATRIEDVPPDELRRRAEEAMRQAKG